MVKPPDTSSNRKWSSEGRSAGLVPSGRAHCRTGVGLPSAGQTRVESASRMAVTWGVGNVMEGVTVCVCVCVCVCVEGVKSE